MTAPLIILTQPHGWGVSIKTWNPEIWMKQSAWLSIGNSGYWCVHLALMQLASYEWTHMAPFRECSIFLPSLLVWCALRSCFVRVSNTAFMSQYRKEQLSRALRDFRSLKEQSQEISSLQSTSCNDVYILQSRKSCKSHYLVCCWEWFTMTRAHSFPRAAEFRAEPHNLPFATEFQHYHGISRNLRNDRWLVRLLAWWVMTDSSVTDFSRLTSWLMSFIALLKRKNDYRIYSRISSTHV